MIEYIKGDLFKHVTPDEDVLKIIPHVCNDQGGWGAGFVVALSKWDPRPEEEYRRIASDPSANFRLGQVQWVPIEKTLYVANMVAQHSYKNEENPRPLRYEYLVKCMRQIARGIEGRKKEIPVEIHAPKFGAALAGGKWEFIEDLMEELWLPTGAEIFVYEL